MILHFWSPVIVQRAYRILGRYTEHAVRWKGNLSFLNLAPSQHQQSIDDTDVETLPLEVQLLALALRSGTAYGLASNASKTVAVQ